MQRFLRDRKEFVDLSRNRFADVLKEIDFSREKGPTWKQVERDGRKVTMLFPGLWRQGDWVRFSARGSSIVTGRSDATLNRGGVRLGTGEFYSVVEELPQITDSLVVHLEDDDGGPGELALFVVLAHGSELDEELRGQIAHILRSQLSPRHVPDTIQAVPAIPRTLTGKKLEAPVKRILRGAPVDAVASRDSLLDPSALDRFAAMASR